MQFTFTSAAADHLAEHLTDSSKSLKLFYDTEGCGCVVSGVPALQIINKPYEDDLLGEGTPYSVWYEPRYEVFFEPQLKIDYNEARHSFSLRSDNQIYTSNLRLLK